MSAEPTLTPEPQRRVAQLAGSRVTRPFSAVAQKPGALTDEKVASPVKIEAIESVGQDLFLRPTEPTNKKLMRVTSLQTIEVLEALLLREQRMLPGNAASEYLARPTPPPVPDNAFPTHGVLRRATTVMLANGALQSVLIGAAASLVTIHSAPILAAVAGVVVLPKVVVLAGAVVAASITTSAVLNRPRLVLAASFGGLVGLGGVVALAPSTPIVGVATCAAAGAAIGASIFSLVGSLGKTVGYVSILAAVGVLGSAAYIKLPSLIAATTA